MAVADAPNRWLYGPGRDLWLGCGLGYIAVLAVLCVFGGEIRLASRADFLPFLTLIVGAPHYGATLLRVYERREDRRAYTFFAVYTTLFLGALFVAGNYWVGLGSILLTVYLTWNPWHYAGQNYGLAVLFLRRRGVDLPARLKRWLYASFLLSFALTFLVMHREGGASEYSPLIYEGRAVTFLPLGLPALLAELGIFGCLLAYAVSLAVCAVGLLRRASWRTLVPTALLVATQALWFSVPLVFRFFGVFQGVEPFSSQHSIYYFFFAALGHSVQYLWITSYYAKRSPDSGGTPVYLVKALLAGTALWTVPGLLFAPQLLGRLPFDMGLAALIAATVNLHHFVLDGAIWKLRDGRIARVLLRPASEAAATPDAVVPRGLLAPLVWVLGAASLVVTLWGYAEADRLRSAFAAKDATRVENAARHLAWLGRDTVENRVQLGKLLEEQGQLKRALVHYDRSVAIFPNVRGYRLAASIHERQGKSAAALAAWQDLATLMPKRANPHFQVGQLALARGEPARAVAALETAVALAPDKAEYRAALDQARARLPGTGAPRGNPPY